MPDEEEHRIEKEHINKNPRKTQNNFWFKR
jgi:hypothetical protein